MSDAGPRLKSMIREPRQVSRRRLLKATATIGGVAWLAPAVEFFSPSAASAQTSGPSSSSTREFETFNKNQPGTYTYATAGYTTFAVSLLGGGGGQGDDFAFGIGGSTVSGTLSIPDSVTELTIIVGAGGGGTYSANAFGFGKGGAPGLTNDGMYLDGAGGGGGSAILVGDVPIVVAGGGGGGGGSNNLSGYPNAVGGEVDSDGGVGESGYVGSVLGQQTYFYSGGGGGGGGYRGGSGGGYNEAGASGSSLVVVPAGYVFTNIDTIIGVAGEFAPGNGAHDSAYPHGVIGGDGSVVITPIS